MLDNNPTNYDIDLVEIKDTAILWAKSIGQSSDNVGVGRALAVDTTGNLWVDMYMHKEILQGGCCDRKYDPTYFTRSLDR